MRSEFDEVPYERQSEANHRVNVVVQGQLKGLEHMGINCVHYTDGNPLEVSDVLWDDVAHALEAAVRECAKCNAREHLVLVIAYVAALVTMVLLGLPDDVVYFVLIVLFVVFATVAVLSVQATFYLETLIEEQINARLGPVLAREGYQMSVQTVQSKFSGPICFVSFSRQHHQQQRISHRNYSTSSPVTLSSTTRRNSHQKP